ncbi:copper chaperone PCu(A)C [Microbacterium sp.]|uniref:copper chaperone PCu(A)C n=1 Tax=Microbacterium sp. TaxID=51671 RepID=UPI0025FB33A0|nr:copper chaperone PCu(A)C [Microbacterium sp.]
MNIRTKKAAVMVAILTAAALTFTGCASTTPTAGEQTATEADAITIADAWVKSADSGMSAAFGTLENASDADVTVSSAETAASAMVELHETVENDAGEMVMRPIDGGFVIPAGATLDLVPGGSHIMLMDLTAPLTAGDEVALTLTFSDGSTYEFTAPVKDYSGANENYEGGDTGMDSGH